MILLCKSLFSYQIVFILAYAFQKILVIKCMSIGTYSFYLCIRIHSASRNIKKYKRFELSLINSNQENIGD